jgi:sugar lactone lactonase YvrE
MQIPRVIAAVLCAAAWLAAVETKTWQQADMAAFEKGSLNKVSLSSDGRLMLAPAVREVFDASVTFLWSVARDSKGNLYAGGGGLGGSKAKLFMIDAGGKSKTLAELEGMGIQAIAIDRQDRVYAATSPDGKVYRVDSSGKPEVFYDPKAKYIWALAFSSRGDLFVGTGDQGEIHRVTAAGSGSVFFQTEETHARSLAIDASDNLIVGTDPSGLILRVTPAGEGFVLYQAAKREITAVAVAPDGSIYGAGVGNKQNPTPPAAPANPLPLPPPPAAGGNTVTLTVGRPGAAPPPSLSTAPTAITGGSEIYRVAPDGYPRRVWNHAQDLVYALAFDGGGRLIAGAGNHGGIYRLESDHGYTLLLNLTPSQVTGFCSSPDGKLYAVTGNIGKVFSIGPDKESSGTFESDIYDAGAFSFWGRVDSMGSGGGSLEFETRSGNLNRAQKNWSPWAKLNAGRVASPAARFLQYRATLRGSAELTDVDVAYQMKNAPPAIEELEITPANYKFPAASAATPATPALTLPPLGRRNAASSTAVSSDSGTSPALTWSKGQMGARWLANDENGDTLAFKVEIRGENETGWKLLKDKIRERYLSWDSTAFPDGKYLLRASASDAPSNPPEQALAASRDSEPFLIDNTAPEITGLAAAPSGGKVEIRFHGKDALSTLGKAEYSVNGGDWVVVEPTTRITDSREHDYRVLIDRAPGEMTVAVRLSDEYYNEAVAKTVVK